MGAARGPGGRILLREGGTAHTRPGPFPGLPPPGGPPPPLRLLPGPPHRDPSSPSRQPLPTGEHLRICPQGYTCCTSEMEENLANRSRTELETALLEGSRALQATLAAQQRGFDGEQAWGPWTLTAGVGTWGIPRGAGQSGRGSRSPAGLFLHPRSQRVPSALQRGPSASRWPPGTQSSASVCQDQPGAGHHALEPGALREDCRAQRVGPVAWSQHLWGSCV